MSAGNGSIPRRVLGKTGVEVSAIAMGGIVVMNMPQKDADAMVRWHTITASLTLMSHRLTVTPKSDLVQH